MNVQWSIESNGVLRLSGDVTAEQLSVFVHTLLDAADYPGLEEVDLSAVTKADSVVLALILAVNRRQGKFLRINGLPSSLQSLWELYRLDQVLQVTS